MNSKICLTILASSLLLGCATKPPPNPDLGKTVVERVEYIPYDCSTPPAVSHVRFHDFVWKKAFDDEDNVVWSLTADAYAALGKNMSIILEATKQVIGQRDFWKKCIDDSLKRLEEHNNT